MNFVAIKVHRLFRFTALNLLSVSQIQLKFSIHFGIILRIHYFTNLQLTHGSFREFTMTLSSLTQIHYLSYEFTRNSLQIRECTVNSLSSLRIHYKSSFFSRIHYKFIIYTQNYYEFTILLAKLL